MNDDERRIVKRVKISRTEIVQYDNSDWALYYDGIRLPVSALGSPVINQGRYFAYAIEDMVLALTEKGDEA